MTTGREIMMQLPAKAGAAREAAILDHVRKANFRPIQWSWIETNWNGHIGRIAVMSDALALGDANDWFRVNVTCTTQQHIADMLGLQMITTKVSDLVHAQSVVKISPCLQKPDAEMADTHRMFLHHAEVERKRAGMPGLVSTVGKDWVITQKLLKSPTKAANYGWHAERAPYNGKWQPLGLAHNLSHVDYSQVCRLMRTTMMVDGVEMSVASVLRSAELHGLLSDEGPITIVRHPGVVPYRFETIRPPEHVLDVDDVEPMSSIPLTKVIAKNFTPTKGRAIDLIVVHSMEAAEKLSTAEAVAKWFAGASAPKASAHYCVDSDSVVQCVEDKDVAWHAPGANHNGIGIEHAGYAKQTAADWSDEFSKNMLLLSAKLAAQLCGKYKIPVEFVNADGLIASKRGITTHAEVSKAFRKSTHWDPGPNFPMDEYLSAIRKRVQG